MQPADSSPEVANYFLSNVKFALDVISKKWVVDILMKLTGDYLRFSQLEKYLPAISSKVLTERLAELQKYELIRKDVVTVTPLNIRYTVSSNGLEILRSLAKMSKIGFKLKSVSMDV